MSLSYQLLIVLLGLFSVTLTAFSFFNTYRQTEQLDNLFRDESKALINNIATASVDGLLQSDYTSLENLLQRNSGFESVQQLIIFDKNGKSMAHGTREPDSSRFRITLTPTHAQPPAERLKTGGVMLITLPDHYQMEVWQSVVDVSVVGYVYGKFYFKDLKQARSNLLWVNSLIAMASIVMGVGAVTLFLRRPLYELRALGQFAQNINNQDGSQLTLQPTSRETRHLIQSLNWTSQRLFRSKQTMSLARDRAERANELKSQFLANMSHEIRTPLNGILGLTEALLQNEQLPNAARTQMKLVNQSAESLLRVVNDVLDFSKIEANKLDFESRPFALRQLIHNCLNPLRSALKPEVALEIVIHPDVPDQLIGDEVRIAQVVLNLVGNAIKFTTQGYVRLHITPAPQTALAGTTQPAVPVEGSDCLPTMTLSFSVSDTGIGIAAEDQARVFDAFSQADNSTTRRFGGTGLGLAICSRLVKHMDGVLQVKSSPGQGSCFYFTISLPIAPEGPTVNAHSEAQAADRGSDSVTDNPSDGPRDILAPVADLHVLVAEDNHVNQQLITHVLTRLGITCEIAQNGQEAIDLLKNADYDAVFMDLHMPVLGGLEATRHIRQVLGYSTLPIIGLTADAVSGTREACLSAGMNAWVSKPYRQHDIEKTLQALQLHYAPIPMGNFDHDSDLLKTMAGITADDLRSQRQVILRSFAERDDTALARCLHTVKGHCALFGESGLAQLLQVFESRAVQADPVNPITELDIGYTAKQLEQLASRLDKLANTPS